MTGRTPWTPSREPVASAVPSVRAGTRPAPVPWLGRADAPPGASSLDGFKASRAPMRWSPRKISTDVSRGRGGSSSRGESTVWRWGPPTDVSRGRGGSSSRGESTVWRRGPPTDVSRGQGGGSSRGESTVWRRGPSSGCSTWPRGRPSFGHGPRVSEWTRFVTPRSRVSSGPSGPLCAIDRLPSSSFEEGSWSGSRARARARVAAGGECSASLDHLFF